MIKPRFAWWKFITTWIFFLLLHFSYETFPNPLFKIIGEEGETTFFHMKMLFFAYLFSSLIEYFVERKHIQNLGTFIYARMLISVAYPWLTITAWFTVEALTHKMLTMPWEIIYANLMTLFGIYGALRLEEVFTSQYLRPALKGFIWLLFAAALISYISFSFNTPVDFFTTPLEFAP